MKGRMKIPQESRNTVLQFSPTCTDQLKKKFINNSKFNIDICISVGGIVYGLAGTDRVKSHA